MAIFADLKFEAQVQVADKLRLSATKSFVSKGSAEISLIEIQPESDAGFIDVTGDESKDWYLDWAYSTNGEKTVTVRITTDGDPITFSRPLTVLTESEDALLSSDEDLIALESDVLDYLPDGKNSFKAVHRKSRDLILDHLDRMGYVDDDGARLTKAALVEKEEFRTWSKYMALRLIFFDLSNQIDDVYMEKSKDYKALEELSRHRVRLPLDTDGDGEVKASEEKRFDSIRLVVV